MLATGAMVISGRNGLTKVSQQAQKSELMPMGVYSGSVISGGYCCKGQQRPGDWIACNNNPSHVAETA